MFFIDFNLYLRLRNIIKINQKLSQNNTKGMKEKIDEIKKGLIWGDIRVISNVSGFSYSAVSKMLSGKRTVHPLVLHAAEKLIEARKNKIVDNINQSI